MFLGSAFSYKNCTYVTVAKKLVYQKGQELFEEENVDP